MSRVVSDVVTTDSPNNPIFNLTVGRMIVVFCAHHDNYRDFILTLAIIKFAIIIVFRYSSAAWRFLTIQKTALIQNQPLPW